MKRLEKMIREMKARLDRELPDEVDLKPVDERMTNLAKMEEQLNNRAKRQAMVKLEYTFYSTFDKESR